VTLDLDAQRAQLFYPTPDRRATDAHLTGNLGAAKHDHRVLGEQAEQLVNAPIGGFGDGCGAPGHRERKAKTEIRN
jgi:hypothetical protein